MFGRCATSYRPSFNSFRLTVKGGKKNPAVCKLVVWKWMSNRLQGIRTFCLEILYVR